MTIKEINTFNSEEETFNYNNSDNELKNKKFSYKIYNDPTLFNYYNIAYLIYFKNSCWIDTFIILYMFVYKTYISEIINISNVFQKVNDIKLLNELTDVIIQNNINKSIKFFDLYKEYSNNYNNNFLYLDKNTIGIFNTIDIAYKLFEDNIIVCIKCIGNRTCTGMCKFSLGESFIHYCSPILSIPISKILDEHYTNPVK